MKQVVPWLLHCKLDGKIFKILFGFRFKAEMQTIYGVVPVESDRWSYIDRITDPKAWESGLNIDA
jgi:hypothetical protein